MEVKGGRISYSNRAYFSNGKEIKNPYEQVRNNMYYMKDVFNKNIKSVLMGYCVGFPDSKAQIPIDGSIDYEEITFDIDDIKNLDTKILKIYKYWQKSISLKSPSVEVIESIIKLLVPEPKELLNSKIEYDNKHWLRLSETQENIIREALESKRYFVSGRAGTGKTILAIIMSRILLKQKNKILFLTFNRRLQIAIENEDFDNK